MSYATCYNAMQSARSELARLEQERAELMALAAEVRRGRVEFSRQAAEKRASASRAQQMAHCKVAFRFGQRYLELTGGAFQEGVHAAFAGTLCEIARAIAQVELAISSAEARIDAAERSLELLRSAERARGASQVWSGVRGGAW